jgi:hypothetical protein
MTDPTLMVADEITDPCAPFTPAPTLVKQWVTEVWHEGTPARLSLSDMHIATEAARWGADQELKACCKLIEDFDGTMLAAKLRAARRPKPPSLKEQALKALDTEGYDLSVTAASVIRRALEQLDD